MKIIREPIPLAKDILGKSPLCLGQFCRLLTYTVCAEHADGVLLCNLLTKAIILLDKNDADVISTFPAPFSEQYKELADYWFLVPDDLDEKKLSDNLKSIAKAVFGQTKKKTLFTIFTTTDCNARCFYCFESGTKRHYMSAETALDVAEYICDNYQGKTVTLHWFGGEPLLNMPVIDSICQYLRDRNVQYRSVMTTNGYCFSSERIACATAQWHLEKVQITLDGTQNEYNLRKRYINCDENPFARVMQNITGLAEADVQVHIRLNVDRENVDDIYNLCYDLCGSLGSSGKKNITIYPVMIFEGYGYRPVSYEQQERQQLWKRLSDLNAILRAEGMAPQKPLGYTLALHQCMCDDPSAVTILYDGRLGKCEHYPDSESFGSIYSKTMDMNQIKKWQIYDELRDDCKSCWRYPECMLLTSCPAVRHDCPDYLRNSQRQNYQSSLLLTYEMEKKGILFINSNTVCAGAEGEESWN